MVDSIKPIDTSGISNIAPDEVNRTKRNSVTNTGLSGSEQVTQLTQGILNALEKKLKPIMDLILSSIPADDDFRLEEKTRANFLYKELISAVTRMNSREEAKEIGDNLVILRKFLVNIARDFSGENVPVLDKASDSIQDDIKDLMTKAPILLRDEFERAKRALEQAHSFASQGLIFKEQGLVFPLINLMLHSFKPNELFDGKEQELLKFIKVQCEVMIERLPPSLGVLAEKLKVAKSALKDAIVIPLTQVIKEPSHKASMRQLRQRV